MKPWRLALALCVASAPLVVAAQVLKCTDPATGKVTYTNQRCERGRPQLVLPQPSAEELARMQEDDLRALQRRQLQLNQQYLDVLKQKQAQADAVATASPPPARNQTLHCAQAEKEADFRSRSHASDAQLQAAQWNVQYACHAPASALAVNEADCASARKELLFRAASNSTTPEALQTARAVAAAACGAPLPTTVVVETAPAAPVLVYPPAPYCRTRYCRLPLHSRMRGGGWGHHLPAAPGPGFAPTPLRQFQPPR